MKRSSLSLLLASSALASPALAYNLPSPAFANYDQRVANNAALTALPINSGVIGGVIHREAYRAQGDGGAADYYYSAAACPLNSGGGDGGSQIPASDGNCFLLMPRPAYSTAAFGSYCDAKVSYGYYAVTAGSGGTRQISAAAATPISSADVGKTINVGLGGASATAAWQGVIASVSAGSPTVITVTAPAGTAVGTYTQASIQWGDDDTAPIKAAIAALQGTSAAILLPGQCGVSSEIDLTANSAQLYGTLPPPGRRNGVSPPYSPPLSSAFVWLGANGGVVFNQKSADNAFGSRYQHVRNLMFYGGNSAAVGRNIATVSFSAAENLQAQDATTAQFNYGTGGANGSLEYVGTCNLVESNFLGDGQSYGGDAFDMSGVAANNSDTCQSIFGQFVGVFSAGKSLRLLYADHNNFNNYSAIGGTSYAGVAANAVSVEMVGLDGTHTSQANGFFGLGVSVTTSAQGHVSVGANAPGNFVAGLDVFNPPTGWTLNVASGAIFDCRTTNGGFCFSRPVAQLPTCGNTFQTAVGGHAELVSDASSATPGAALTGGGSNIVPAVCKAVGGTWGWYVQ